MMRSWGWGSPRPGPGTFWGTGPSPAWCGKQGSRPREAAAWRGGQHPESAALTPLVSPLPLARVTTLCERAVPLSSQPLVRSGGN